MVKKSEIKKKINLILELQNYGIEKSNILKKVWLSFLMRKSDFLICDSARLVKESVKYGMDRRNTLISMFGVDTKIYKKSRIIFSEKNMYFIGSNRKLEKIYDVFTFIKAANLICDKRKDVHFYIAGDGALKEKYVKFVSKEKLTQRIKFLGLLNKEQMLDFYNKIDIYVSTSLSDGGLAASIAEAMSFERLVFVSDNSDNKKWIKNKINGYIFKSGDYQTLSDLILKAIERKEKSIEIAKNSRDLILKKYSYFEEMTKVANKYNEIINF